MFWHVQFIQRLYCTSLLPRTSWVLKPSPYQSRTNFPNLQWLQCVHWVFTKPTKAAMCCSCWARNWNGVIGPCLGHLFHAQIVQCRTMPDRIPYDDKVTKWSVPYLFRRILCWAMLSMGLVTKFSCFWLSIIKVLCESLLLELRCWIDLLRLFLAIATWKNL